MLSYTTRYLLPTSVLRNIEKLRDRLDPLWNEKGILIWPHGHLAQNLVNSGALHGMNVLGTLPTQNEASSFFYRPTFSFADLHDLDFGLLLLVDTRQGEELEPNLQRITGQRQIPVVNLCESYDHISYRTALARQLSPPPDIFFFPHHVEICIPKWGLGDKLCALSATREFARRHPELQVHFNSIPVVANAYEDQLVTPGSGMRIDIARPDSMFAFWEHDGGLARNYVGCYQLCLGLDLPSQPTIELPDLPPLHGLENTRYIALQPRSPGKWALPNMDVLSLQKIIDNAPLPVVLAGQRNSHLGLRNIDLRHTGNELSMLSLIQHAALVVTPRSASAHIAAAYGVPAIVWSPNDGINWHLDYPNWNMRLLWNRDPRLSEIIIDEMIDRLGPIGPRRSRGLLGDLLTISRYTQWLLWTQTKTVFFGLLTLCARIVPAPLRVRIAKSAFGIRIRPFLFIK